MAQWSRADHTLYTKLVYYGPAFGGKTTNLEMLHRLTDPDGSSKLLSVQTANDRTLFFDLLPFDLGDILGYKVAMKLYTVPGQVRYDTTRQVVMGGADALIFVADSSADRRDQNVWSLQNLRMNMRTKRLDPKRVPVLYQFNKQDLPDAAPTTQVASWLRIPANAGIPAVAVEGRGVLETFKAACGAMLERLVASTDQRNRAEVDPKMLKVHLERAFAPHLARLEQGVQIVPKNPAPAAPQNPIVLQGDDLLERSVQTSVHLGERLATESTRSARLEREADAFRQLSESLRGVGASFDRDRIADAALLAAQQVLEAPFVSLVALSGGRPVLERGVGGDGDPLLGLEGGRHLLGRMVEMGGACVVDDLHAECPDADVITADLRAVASVPVAEGRALVAYAAQPDGALDEHDIRFLVTVAGHLAAGLEKSLMHEQLEQHRDELGQVVAERTEELREAYEALRKMDEMKQRLLGSLTAEMKSPVMSILGAAQAVRDFTSTDRERKELVGSIVNSAEILKQHLNELFRLVSIESGAQPLEFAEATPEDLIQEAIRLAGHPGVQYRIKDLPGTIKMDREGLPRAVANLIDNAVKFSPATSLVRVALEGVRRGDGDGAADTLALAVSDRGPGVAASDRERIFDPFEQGRDASGLKPAGIGIGLHEARSMARCHGGSLECIPREGGGSEFRLIVPLDPEHESDQESSTEAARV